MQIRTVALFLAVLLSSQSLADSQESHGRWSLYTNVRFKYAICYPNDLLVPQGETVNSAGNTFVGTGSEKLIVYGENTEETLREALSRQLELLANDHAQVSYRAVMRHAYVISFRQGEDITYQKSFFSNNEVKIFSLTYPVSEKLTYDSIAKSLNTCFSDLARSPEIIWPR